MATASDEAMRKTGSAASFPCFLGFASLRLESHVLVVRERDEVHRVEHVLGHARPDASECSIVHDRGEHGPGDCDLWDAMEQRLALGGIALSRLQMEEVVELGIAAIGVAPLGVHELRYAA